MEDPNHKFLTNKWFIYNWFMDLSNPFDFVVHYLLIEGMTYLGHWDGFFMISSLVCMITHYTRPTYDESWHWLSCSYDLTKLLYCIGSEPWEDTKLMLRSLVTLTYKWDPKVVIYYSLWNESLEMETDDNMYT